MSGTGTLSSAKEERTEKRGAFFPLPIVPRAYKDTRREPLRRREVLKYRAPGCWALDGYHKLGLPLCKVHTPQSVKANAARSEFRFIAIKNSQ